MIVNKNQLAAILGKSEEWLTQMQKNTDFPVIRKGRGRAGSDYETSEVIAWINRRNLDNLIGNDDLIDLEEAKRRKMAAEAALAEVELEKMRGTLVEMETIEKTWTELVANCRAKLLSIPAKTSPEVFAAENLTEVKAVLKGAILEALNELADQDISPQGPESIQATA